MVNYSSEFCLSVQSPIEEVSGQKQTLHYVKRARRRAQPVVVRLLVLLLVLGEQRLAASLRGPVSFSLIVLTLFKISNNNF